MSRRDFRKTDRRQSAPCFKPVDGVRAVFLLPPRLAGAVAPGAHGYGVFVEAYGRVVVKGRSRDHVGRLASWFLLKIAINFPGFTIAATIGPSDCPERTDPYFITIGAPAVVTRSGLAPQIVHPL